MIKSFLSRRLSNRISVPCVPDGRRLYAIGDIHGRLDLLKGLLAQIDVDNDQRGGPVGELIFLGDFVDRGPESAGVLDHLIALKESRPTTRFLTGNHEEVFLKSLSGDIKALRLFTRIGGAETIASYGINSEEYSSISFADLLELLGNIVPALHRQFLESHEDMIIEGDYAFVHAGVRPGTALADQRSSDLHWIRDEFLNAKLPFEKMVVHGHTVENQVMQLSHRIGIDTGAYETGILTAMGFERESRWVLQERKT